MTRGGRERTCVSLKLTCLALLLNFNDAFAGESSMDLNRDSEEVFRVRVETWPDPNSVLATRESR